MTQWFDTEKDCRTPHAIDIYSTLDETLKAAIGLGGGFSLPDRFMPFWFFDYRPSLACELLSGDDERIDTYEIPRSVFLKTCREIWNEKKFGQMTLF